MNHPFPCSRGPRIGSSRKGLSLEEETEAEEENQEAEAEEEREEEVPLCGRVPLEHHAGNFFSRRHARVFFLHQSKCGLNSNRASIFRKTNLCLRGEGYR